MPFMPALRRAALRAEQAEIKQFTGLTVMGPGIIPTTVTLGSGYQSRAAGWNLDAVIQDAFERSVWVFKCVDLYAKYAARLPVAMEEDDEAITEHPLLRVLNVQANPMETGKQFRKRLAALLLLSKIGVFVEVTWSRGGEIVRLDILDPARVRIIPDLHGMYIDYFEFTSPDGTVRNLPTERVVWIRDPHPTDPFCGTTPIEAAGVSIELDHLARVYNTSFIKRDARPGGILGIDTDTLEDRELERIEKTFQPGAHHAGKITAIGTGPGGLKYIDTSARPRDMAYETTSEKAKSEVLAAFSTPESLLGNTAGRTYDNASQDEESFFSQYVNFLDLITDAFKHLVRPSEKLLYDTSSIEALELPKKRARAEAREEFNAGLRSIKEYREMRPELEEIDNPQTRALWVSPAKAPVPGRPEDAAELGVGNQMGGGAGLPPAPGGLPSTPDASGGATPLPGDPTMPSIPPTTPADMNAEGALADQVAGAPSTTPAALSAPAEPATAPAPAAASPEQLGLNQSDVLPNGLAAGEGTSTATGVAHDVTGTGAEDGKTVTTLADLLGDDTDPSLLEGKSLMDRIEIKAAPPPEADRTYAPDQSELDRAELAIKAALDALLARQVGVIKARLDSPKTRRGTRFWNPGSESDPHTGDAPIDTERLLAADRWSREAGDTLQPITQQATQDSITNLYTALAAAGVLGLATGTTATVLGRPAKTIAASADDIAAAAARIATLPAMAAAGVAEAAMQAWLEDQRLALDAYLVETNPDLTILGEWFDTTWAAEGRKLTNSLAVTIGQASVGGGREAAVEALNGPDGAPAAPDTITRQWTTRHDERVRLTHVEADGQRRPVGEPFDVGGYPVAYPSDPMAPAPVARGCRCWLVYVWAANTHLQLPPAPGEGQGDSTGTADTPLAA